MSKPGDIADTVKQQADIVRVIGDYVKLKKAGAQNFTGLCPFHQEKTPSFSVHATRQFFHCFGCGVSGDVFTFVQKVENITFPEALRLIAQKLDIKLPKMEYSSPHEAKEARMRGQLMDMHERACAFFEDQLRRPEAAHAREYLANRGLSQETIRTFRIGYAPELGFVLRDRLKADFDEELQRASGLFSWKSDTDAATMYSRFRNRVVFPITNEHGKIIAFTGRTLSNDEKAGPKYLNSPETPIYSKSKVLYNLDKAKEAIRALKYSIIVEGQMDCISVYAAGFHNVIASSGTAFTQAQVGLLAKWSKQIIVNFDRDSAGAKAAERSIDLLLEEGFDIRIVTLDPGLDPDLLIRRKGKSAYERELHDAQNYFMYLLREARLHFPVSTANGKMDALKFMLPHINKLPSQIARDAVVRDVAQKLEIDFPILQQELKKATIRRSSELSLSSDVGITHSEKVLVRCFCSNSLSCQEAKEYLMQQSEFNDLISGLLTEALLKELRELAPLQAEIIPANVSVPHQALLAKLLSEEGVVVDESVVNAVVLTLTNWQLLRKRSLDIKQGIAEAERRNDVTELLRLKQEKLELDRKLAASQG